MQKTCKRCGCEFESGEQKLRHYCDECKKEIRREQVKRRLSFLEGDENYRRAERALNIVMKRRSRAFESRLLSKDEIAKLNADCDAALRTLSEARKNAWAKWGKLPGKRVNEDLVKAVAQGAVFFLVDTASKQRSRHA